MGAHRTNPTAIASANRPAFEPGAETFRHATETVIELNAEHMAIIDAAVQGARAAGGDERHAAHEVSVDWHPKKTPEKFEVVVYNRMMIGRPNPFLPDPRQVPTAMLRMGEVSRTPLTELQARADKAFAVTTDPERNPQ